MSDNEQVEGTSEEVQQKERAARLLFADWIEQASKDVQLYEKECVLLKQLIREIRRHPPL